ncbi:MAG: tRNA (guanine(10)-N(2))-dimethyltransferase [Candidatus Micrarchaeia archaeon]
MALEVREGKVRLSVPEGVFYNPEMELCRDVSSLCLGALGGKLSVLDGMCASGIRGIRYKKENRNASSLTLSDLSRKAVLCARKNAAKNKMECKVFSGNVCRLLQDEQFDFVELDPFGTPVPYAYDACRCLASKKEGYLSMTATDMAVLCGAHHAACLKNYGAAPLDNEFCHENAVRILAAKAILTAAPFNLAAEPIFTFSHRHYVKMVFSMKQGAERAVGMVKKIGFASYCHGCCFREARRIPREGKCPHCGHVLEAAGPLYTGALWDGAILEKMLALNVKRKYGKAKEIEKTLCTMLSESRIPAYGYYDLHTLAEKRGKRILSTDDALARLRKAGFSAERTHFCPTAIRTSAPHGKVLELAVG